MRRKRIALIVVAVVPLAACASGSDSPVDVLELINNVCGDVAHERFRDDDDHSLAAEIVLVDVDHAVDPAAQAEAAVRAAVDLAQSTFSACLVAMPSCDPSTLAVARAGDLLARNVARINEWNAAGYTVRNRDQFRYVIEERDARHRAARRRRRWCASPTAATSSSRALDRAAPT